ncbi:MAG: DUF3223 domain-containing protein [Ferrimicrobium acidiphilum]
MDAPNQIARRHDARPAKKPRKYSLSSIHSKSEATAYVRAALSRFSLYQPLDDTFAEFFLREILPYHPMYEEKIGIGVISLRLEKNRWGKSSLAVVRVDGSTEIFSWCKCLDNRYPTGNCRPESLKNVYGALREAVYPDIADFRAKQTHGGLCWCADTETWESESHVDHVDPSFLEIVEMFLSDRHLRLENVTTVPHEHSGGHRLESQELADAWRRFHKKHAKLQMLSAHGNLSKGGPRNRTARTRSRTLEDSGKIIGAHFAHAPKSRSRILEGR